MEGTRSVVVVGTHGQDTVELEGHGHLLCSSLGICSAAMEQTDVSLFLCDITPLPDDIQIIQRCSDALSDGICFGCKCKFYDYEKPTEPRAMPWYDNYPATQTQ